MSSKSKPKSAASAASSPKPAAKPKATLNKPRIASASAASAAGFEDLGRYPENDQKLAAECNKQAFSFKFPVRGTCFVSAFL